GSRRRAPRLANPDRRHRRDTSPREPARVVSRHDARPAAPRAPLGGYGVRSALRPSAARGGGAARDRLRTGGPPSPAAHAARRDRLAASRRVLGGTTPRGLAPPRGGRRRSIASRGAHARGDAGLRGDRPGAPGRPVRLGRDEGGAPGSALSARDRT